MSKKAVVKESSSVDRSYKGYRFTEGSMHRASEEALVKSKAKGLTVNELASNLKAKGFTSTNYVGRVKMLLAYFKKNGRVTVVSDPKDPTNKVKFRYLYDVNVEITDKVAVKTKASVKAVVEPIKVVKVKTKRIPKAKVEAIKATVDNTLTEFEAANGIKA